MSIPRTSIALLTFVMFSMGFLPFKPSLTLNNLRFHPPRAVLKSFY